MENGIRPPIQMAVDSMRNLFLGYTGEANAQLIQIDVSKWQEKWPGDSIDLMRMLGHCDYNEVLRRMATRLSGGKNGNEYYA
jgi:hypothetical protein